MADDLSAPLGRNKQKAALGRNPLGTRAGVLKRLPLARMGFALLVLVLAAAGLRIALVNDPEGGRPSTTVAINSSRGNNPVAGEVAKAELAKAPAPASPATAPVSAAPGPQISVIGDNMQGGAAPAALDKDGVLPDLAEETKDGPIPRMSARGQTPFAAYSRPPPPPVVGKPTIAIVVTGLGLNEAGTLNAIDQLPPDVSLAFAPYGKTLPRTTAAARAAGHEMLLEVPFEPFDYPDTDPGPQTLLTGQPARANLDKLYWLMARFGGYVGLVNHTGARFTASATDFGPVMEELGTRGLGYLDDGTSNRSVAPELASANKVPFGRADLMLDADAARAPILAALDHLVSQARARGSAIGVISALPVSIVTLGEWLQGLDGEGVQLVPVSALMK